jgi:hypothetical protein
MSLFPSPIQDKKCFVYCGDRCNCEISRDKWKFHFYPDIEFKNKDTKHEITELENNIETDTGSTEKS